MKTRRAVYPDSHYPAYAHRVIDGDTYHLEVDLGFHTAITIPCRLRGVNTPELNTDEGKAARDFVVALLHPGHRVVGLLVQSYRDRQSFARWIVDIWLADSQAKLADVLVDAGHGKYVE